jgi:hypothetical protein
MERIKIGKSEDGPLLCLRSLEGKLDLEILNKSMRKGCSL